MDKSEYIFFKDKSEYIYRMQRVSTYPLGKLLFSFLETNWESHLEEAQKLLDRCLLAPSDSKTTIREGLKKPKETIYCIVHGYYRSLKTRFHDSTSSLGTLFPSMVLNELHHKYERDFDEFRIDKSIDEVQDVIKLGGDARKVFEKQQESERTKGNMVIVADLFVRYLENKLDMDFFGGYADIVDSQFTEVAIRFMNWMVKTLKTLCSLQSNIEQMIDYIESPEESFETMKPSQMLCLMQATGFAPYIESSRYYSEISYKRFILDRKNLHVIGSSKHRSDFIEEIISKQLSLEIFITSRSIAALIFYEFDCLCIRNLPIRKCENCGSYFLPFSSASLYCERIIDTETNRTCKDVGAMRKYNQNVSTNAAKALFRRVANAYQMRCKRAPTCYPRAEYEEWKDMAADALEQVEQGLLDFSDFSEKITLPDRK